jgi:hypothetical protein
MLGRKQYSQEELDHARAAIEKQLAAYDTFVATAAGKATDRQARNAQEDFEGLFFNNITLVLDRYFVHRVRMVAGKDGNPLNEVEMICDSLMNNDGVLEGNNVVKYVPEQSVVKLALGDEIRLTEDQFRRLSDAFFAELERRFR